MTEPDGRYGEELRRALSAVVDPVQPAGDGLEKIRARAAHRPPVFAWFTAYVAYLPAALVTQVRIAASWAGTAADPSVLIARLRSIRHWPRRALGVLRRPDAWLRPALAVTGALALVVIATLLVPRLRHSVEVVFATNTSSGPTQNALGGPTSGPGSVNASGSHRITSAPYSSAAYSPGSVSPCVPRSQGGSGQGYASTPTVLIPFGPMPGISQPAQPQMLGLLPPNRSGVVPNSCHPSMARQAPQQPGSTPTGSQPGSTPPTPTPTPTSPTSTPISSSPTSTPTSTPPTSSTPQGSTSPTGQASASPIPG